MSRRRRTPRRRGARSGMSRRAQPFVWLMPRGPIDPRDGPERPNSPIRPPFPDIVIASGRRAVPYLRAVKKASNGLSFTVFLKDPRTGTGAADLIWVAEHDRLRGANVLVTTTSPHRLAPERLAQARANPPAAIAALPSPARRRAGRRRQPPSPLHGGRHCPLRRPARGAGGLRRRADGLALAPDAGAAGARGRAKSSPAMAAGGGTARARTPMSPCSPMPMRSSPPPIRPT